MWRFLLAFSLLALLPLDQPAIAATAKQKQDTCKFGADHQKLAGVARKTFMAKCMAPADAPARRAKKPQPN